MLYEFIGNTDVERLASDSGGSQQFVDAAARAAGGGIFLHGDDQLVGSCQFFDQFGIQWLDESHVDQRGAQAGRNIHARVYQAAESKDGDGRPSRSKLRLADAHGRH